MITKGNIIDIINEMCSETSVSFENKGAFLLKLFMYPVVDQEFIIKNLSSAVHKDIQRSDDICIISVRHSGAKEDEYRYIVEYKMTCSICKQLVCTECNVCTRYFDRMCQPCKEHAQDLYQDQQENQQENDNYHD